MIKFSDEKREFIVPGNRHKTVSYCAERFLEKGNEAIKKKNFFSVALSGGNTPLEVYKKLSSKENQNRIDWKRVFLFWSDERSVPPNHSENNYHTAMEIAFDKLPIPSTNIFRMKAEKNIEQNAKSYEANIKSILPSSSFDLIILGMGEDGHTASLFPETDGLKVLERLVIANYVPQKNTWRMSLTFPCINSSKEICVYVFGKNKAKTLEKILNSPHNPQKFPIHNIGTAKKKALWILDNESAENVVNIMID